MGIRSTTNTAQPCFMSHHYTSCNNLFKKIQGKEWNKYIEKENNKDNNNINRVFIGSNPNFQ